MSEHLARPLLKKELNAQIKNLEALVAAVVAELKRVSRKI